MSRALFVTLCLAAPLYSQSVRKIEFNRDIRPILSDKCFACHGPDKAHRISAMRFDIEDLAKQTLSGNRFAIVPGNAAASEMIQRVSSDDDDFHMPPSPRQSLTAKEIDTLKAWINQGASWEKHWSFNAPVRPQVPPAKETAWPRNAIDNFVMARLQNEGLAHSPEAQKSALIRRVSFDLTGTPPTPEEVAAFVSDRSATAYDKLVDRLLASPRYGERMAVPWLDAARYADSNGYQLDGERRMWPWRDWVVNALNSNKPFDQFVVEQLAGDLLPNATLEQRVATGFNRNHRGNAEGGIIAEEYAAEYVSDRVDTTATVFLGLTVGCARCHDHRYDPISQKEYYQLFAYFNNVQESGKARRVGNSPPVITASNAQEREHLAKLDRDLATARQTMTQLRPTMREAMAAWEAKLDAGSTRTQGGPANGLVYHMDGNLGAAKMSPAGDAKFADGPAGPALVLNGSQFADAGNVAGFATYGYLNKHPKANEHFDDAFTFAAWIYPTGPTGAIVTRARDAAEPTGYGVYLKDGKVHLYHVTKWVDEGIRLETANTLALNQWHQVTAVYDGTRLAAGMKIYVDGVEQKLVIQLDDMNNDNNGGGPGRDPLRIGGGGGADNRFHGQIADVRAYNRVLDAEEVSMLATASSLQQIAAKPQTARTAGETAKLERYFVEMAAPEPVLQAWKRIVALEKERAEYFEDIPTTMVMEEMPTPRESFLLQRGSYSQPGERVYPALPSILPPGTKEYPKNRLGLAQWLTDPSHPLLARVTVNRFWQMYFGTGLVKTTEDFGSQGEAPSHPELLDWLATEFIRSGWDVKALQRLIVTSATYRQASATNETLTEKDPDNRLLARGPSLRLTAGMIRDQALALSGLLVEKQGGPPVKPYQPAGLWSEVSKKDYVQDHGESLYRRSLYTYFRRSVPPPTMANFDAANRESCVVRPGVTNTPLQALDLMNNVTYLEAARVIGQRMMTEGGSTPDQRNSWAFRLVTGRDPDPREGKVVHDFFQSQLDYFQSSPESARKFIAQGEAPIPSSLDARQLAAYASVASLVLNLDEAVTKQ